MVRTNYSENRLKQILKNSNTVILMSTNCKIFNLVRYLVISTQSNVPF